MAKVISPLVLKGTLNDINFYEASGQQLARERGKTGVSKKEFKENPSYDPIRKQGIEFGSCARQSVVFRNIVKPFYDLAKEVSFAGRVNQLLFEVLQEDVSHSKGARQLVNGLQRPEALEVLLHFEANQLRPLKKVLKTDVTFDWQELKSSLTSIDVVADLQWPEADANRVHLQFAVANWNFKAGLFQTQYSNALVLERESGVVPLDFQLEGLERSDLWLAYLFVGFSNQVRRQTKWLHKKYNTACVVGVKGF